MGSFLRQTHAVLLKTNPQLPMQKSQSEIKSVEKKFGRGILKVLHRNLTRWTGCFFVLEVGRGRSSGELFARIPLIVASSQISSAEPWRCSFQL